MTTDNTDLELFAMVDQFIDLANRLVAEEQHAVGRVSAAISYAAARFNAHEASCSLPDLATTRAATMAWFVERYGNMLAINFDEHGALVAHEEH